jgi:hypothetical protein
VEAWVQGQAESVDGALPRERPTRRILRDETLLVLGLSLGASGVSALISFIGSLTEARDRVVTTLRESPTCVGPWFVLRGHPSFPATIAAETAEPFPAELVLASADGELCLS